MHYAHGDGQQGKDEAVGHTAPCSWPTSHAFVHVQGEAPWAPALATGSALVRKRTHRVLVPKSSDRAVTDVVNTWGTGLLSGMCVQLL